ncbi:esterase-like [Gossypium australe]|uniref:Esterase-like n=1 Tax=Gossypium australe TaxID=47621 RepID=A0A5B6VC39_9ROSI|nr:esterase-like [Gossypium australe]
MSARGIHRSGTRGRGRCRRGLELSLPLWAMLRILERVAGPHSDSRGWGLVTERLRSNGAELFRCVTGVAPNVAEYWLEAMERIMIDLDCTPE